MTQTPTAHSPASGQARAHFTVPAKHPMVTVLGSGDALLRVIEKAFPAADIHVRGNEISAVGDAGEVALVQRLFDEMMLVLRTGQPMTEDAVERSIAMLRASENGEGDGRRPRPKCSRRTSCPRAAAPSAPRRSTRSGTSTRSTSTPSSSASAPPVPARRTSPWRRPYRRCSPSRSTGSSSPAPRSRRASGSASCPARSTRRSTRTCGPLYDALHDMLDPDSIPRLMAAGTIEVAPLAYMRGRTLNDAFIILDEAQNTSAEQMKMFLTRLGFDSKIVITGDVTQVDLPERDEVGPAPGPGHPGGPRRRPLLAADSPTMSYGTSWSAVSSTRTRSTTTRTAPRTAPTGRGKAGHERK